MRAKPRGELEGGKFPRGSGSGGGGGRGGGSYIPSYIPLSGRLYQDDEDDEEDINFITFRQLFYHICIMIAFGSLLDHFWITFGSLLEHCWITFGTLVEH
eukprot:9318729-Heterocapsa_arctica.AAC.1